MKVGEKYYFIIHAYYHYLGTVVEILGTQRVVINDVVRVHSCQRGFTEFFEDGCENDTVMTFWPDGKEFTYLDATPWPHAIPKRKK